MYLLTVLDRGRESYTSKEALETLQENFLRHLHSDGKNETIFVSLA